MTSSGVLTDIHRLSLTYYLRYRMRFQPERHMYCGVSCAIGSITLPVWFLCTDSSHLRIVHRNHPVFRYNSYFSIYIKAFCRRFGIVITPNYVHLCCLWYNAYVLTVTSVESAATGTNYHYFSGVLSFSSAFCSALFVTVCFTDPDSICTVFPHMPSDLNLLTDYSWLLKRPFVLNLVKQIVERLLKPSYFPKLPCFSFLVYILP